MTFLSVPGRFAPVHILAILVLLTALLAGPSQGFAQSSPVDASATLPGDDEPIATMRVEVNVVNVLFTVRNHRRQLVPDLPKDEFKVRENGVAQELRYFAAGTRQPLLVTLMVDTSDSQRRFFEHQNGVASRFTESILEPQDEAMLVSFDSRIDLVQERTHSAPEMLQAIRRLKIGGSRPTLADDPDYSRHTVIYDAIVRVARRMAPIPGRKAMILLTDGEDVGSKADIKKAVAAAQHANVIVYALLIADRRYYTSRGYEHYQGDQRMKLLAKETGGGFIDIGHDPQQLDEAFARIERELRNQYSLGYVSSNQRRDGKFREIKVSSRHRYRIQARRGYYAPSPDRSQVATADNKAEP